MDENGRVDGMDYEQVRFNFLSHLRSARCWQQKMNVARKEHTRARYEKKRDWELRHAETNRRRIERFKQAIALSHIG